MNNGWTERAEELLLEYPDPTSGWHQRAVEILTEGV